MKPILFSFLQMLKSVKRDRMLVAACIAPLLVGIAIKYAIPFMEEILIAQTNRREILHPYYGLFDIFFSMITSAMFCFAAAMVLLEEHDDHIESYCSITPLGKTGYLISRIFLPALAAFLMTEILLPIFHLTPLPPAMTFFLSLTGTLQGVIIALLVVTLSTNKLEGMAVTKIASVTILGALAPYFLPEPLQYTLAFLPSFWVGKSVCDQKLIYMLPAILEAAIWIFILLKRFRRKMP